jgi:hypothetical protein
MVSLAFGTLAINDVVAAIMTVAICELISRAFYARWPRPPLWLIFANFFKAGVEFAFMADAYKLAGARYLHRFNRLCFFDFNR